MNYKKAVKQRYVKKKKIENLHCFKLLVSYEVHLQIMALNRYILLT